MEQKIREVRPGGIGEELGLEPGDVLLAIDGHEIEDVLDYYFYAESEKLKLKIRTADGTVCVCEVEKDESEDLGLVFEDEFMGQYRSCRNHCIFCFIDQLPKGLRKSLYFKDDDARLSFLTGNYITMTNMSEKDFAKIIRYRMSPINVSVHTTNPELRVKMLKNPRAAEVMRRLVQLKEAGITLNAQIVLCRGINDGEELDRTIRDLGSLIPQMQSVSVVPVGLSRYREGLYPLEPFTKEDAVRVIEQVEPYQERFCKMCGLHFVHLADEFYVLAERELPQETTYDGYLQLENGVGMMRLFMDEAEEALRLAPGSEKRKTLSIATGAAASGMIRDICRKTQEKYPNLTVHVFTILNRFFGERITVSGLLTGKDIIEQLAGQSLGQILLLPGNLLKSSSDVLLDDVTVPEIENALQIPVGIVQSSGEDLIRALTEGL